MLIVDDSNDRYFESRIFKIITSPFLCSSPSPPGKTKESLSPRKNADFFLSSAAQSFYFTLEVLYFTHNILLSQRKCGRLIVPNLIRCKAAQLSAFSIRYQVLRVATPAVLRGVAQYKPGSMKNVHILTFFGHNIKY